MDARAKFNVRIEGPEGAPTMLFAHGFGCDQTMWRKVVPAFAVDHRVIVFDYVGFGGSDLDSYDGNRYDHLQPFADDVLELCRELGLRGVTFVGHSVSSMVGVLAHLADPDVFGALVLVGPSARYIDDGSYVGGFTDADVSDLLGMMESNHLGWQAPLADMVMANRERPELSAELEATFCNTRPDIALDFARVTFLGDNRADLARVRVPTLVLQNSHDSIAPVSAGIFVHEEIPGSRLTVIEGSGHCPQLSAPELTVSAIREFLSQ